MTAIKFEGPITTQEFSLVPGSAMTDTGTSCSYVPVQYYMPIRNKIKELSARPNLRSAKNIVGEDFTIPCDNIPEFPKISFLYGGYWMEMLPEDYFVEFEGQCVLCLFPESFGNDWILGDTFLRGFYSTHDHLN